MQSRASPNPNPREAGQDFRHRARKRSVGRAGSTQSAGIESDLKSLDAVQDAFPGVGGTVIFVREEDAGEAEKIIEEYRQLPPLDDETAEING